MVFILALIIMLSHLYTMIMSINHLWEEAENGYVDSYHYYNIDCKTLQVSIRYNMSTSTKSVN